MPGVKAEPSQASILGAVDAQGLQHFLDLVQRQVSRPGARAATSRHQHLAAAALQSSAEGVGVCPVLGSAADAGPLQRTKKDQAELGEAIKLLQRTDLVRLGEYIHRQAGRPVGCVPVPGRVRPSRWSVPGVTMPAKAHGQAEPLGWCRYRRRSACRTRSTATARRWTPLSRCAQAWPASARGLDSHPVCQNAHPEALWKGRPAHGDTSRPVCQHPAAGGLLADHTHAPAPLAPVLKGVTPGKPACLARAALHAASRHVAHGRPASSSSSSSSSSNSGAVWLRPARGSFVHMCAWCAARAGIAQAVSTRRAQVPLVLKGAALVAGLMLQDHAQRMPEALVAAVLALHDHALLVSPSQSARWESG